MHPLISMQNDELVDGLCHSVNRFTLCQDTVILETNKVEGGECTL